MKLTTIGNIAKVSMLSGSIALITACAATQTVIEHRNLETKTNLSNTIFLDPVSDNQKSVFISVKNTSDQEIDISRRLSNAFKSKGYVVSKNPSDAHYLLQANIRKVGKMSVAASQNALGGGYGSALAGGATGVALGALAQNNTAMLAGGVAGGLVGLAADALVKDVNYSMVTDVQISERVGKGVKVSEEHRASLSQGTGSQLKQVSTRNSSYERYQTRVVSNANKVNLSFQDARPALEAGLVKELVGIF